MIKYVVNGRPVSRDEAMASVSDPNCKGICKSRCSPAPRTDTSFMAGFGTLSKQFAGDEATLERIMSKARAAGGNPSADDIYQPGLAAFEGDPAAFVPRENARGHIRDVCESRGMACHGAVEVKGEQAPPPAPASLSEDITERMADVLISEDPKLARIDRRDVKAEARRKFGGD